MTLEKVRSYLAQWNREKDIIVLDETSETVFLAAQALHTEEERIAKSLSIKRKEGALILVTAGNVLLDNKKFKEFFHFRPHMLPVGEVETLTGHVVGGVCPFALSQDVPVYLDVSLKLYQTVFPACGTKNSAIEVTIPELEEYSKFTEWVDVCKKKQN